MRRASAALSSTDNYLDARRGVAGLFAPGFEELLAASRITFAALVPFFAPKELGRVFGAEEIAELFFSQGPGR